MRHNNVHSLFDLNIKITILIQAIIRQIIVYLI